MVIMKVNHFKITISMSKFNCSRDERMTFSIYLPDIIGWEKGTSVLNRADAIETLHVATSGNPVSGYFWQLR